jgi:hypothetical protein
MLMANFVVLGTELPEESGWLTCDKLVREHPGLKVILVSVEQGLSSKQFAAFVGATTLVDRNAGPLVLLDEAQSALLEVA